MQTFHEFAWFFAHSYHLGQLRRVRIESTSLAPWFRFYAFVASHGGECSFLWEPPRSDQLLFPRELASTTEIPHGAALACGGYCEGLLYNAAIRPGDCGELTFDAHDVQETTWPALLTFLHRIALETGHDPLVVSEYQSHDPLAPKELTWLRYSRISRTLSVEGDPNRDFE